MVFNGSEIRIFPNISQIKAGNTSENWLNEIRPIVYSLYIIYINNIYKLLKKYTTV